MKYLCKFQPEDNPIASDSDFIEKMLSQEEAEEEEDIIALAPQDENLDYDLIDSNDSERVKNKTDNLSPPWWIPSVDDRSTDATPVRNSADFPSGK